MSKDRKQKRRREKRINYSFGEDIIDISREKQKARELRNSAWWRRKIAPGLCFYCGEDYPPDELTMDHKIPLSRGGKSEKINLVPACKNCNNKKKYLLSTEWEEYLEGLKKLKII